MVALTLVQLVVVVALAFWAVLLRRDLKSAEDELVELRRRPAPDDSVQKENQALRAQVAALELEVATEAVNAAALKTAAAKVPAAAAPASPAAALAAVANNPALRTMMARTQKRNLETRFADLFNQFQFSPEQRERFIEVLSAGQTATTEAGLKLIGGNLGAAEQAAIRQQLNEVTAAIDPKIRELLGDDAKFAAYKQFTEQQPERTQVNALKASLAQSGQPPLGTDQAAALTAIMYTERKSFQFAPSPGGDPANPGAVPTAEAMATRVREQEVLNNRIADRAAAVLSPEQLASLRQAQAGRLESLKASAEMARQMLGGTPPVK